jgi:hypothetical protein
MDGDDVSRATRLGRMAAEAIWETVASDAPFDRFATGQLIDRFIAHAGVIPSLPGILAILADLASQPLFVETYGIEHAERARDVIAPIARAAAEELLRRPDAKRLGLSREFLQRLSENSNLLEVA